MVQKKVRRSQKSNYHHTCHISMQNSFFLYLFLIYYDMEIGSYSSHFHITQRNFGVEQKKGAEKAKWSPYSHRTTKRLLGKQLMHWNFTFSSGHIEIMILSLVPQKGFKKIIEIYKQTNIQAPQLTSKKINSRQS